MTTDLLRCALPALTTEGLRLDRARHPFVVQAANEALDTARAAPAVAGPALSRWFRATRRLGSRDRRLVSGMVYDIIRHEGILTRAGATDDAARVDCWPDLVAGDRLEAAESTTPEEDYAAALSLPASITSAWLVEHGPEGAAALGAAMAARAPTTVRANRVRCTRDQLQARLADEGLSSSPVPDAPDALHVHTRANFPTLASFREGWFEVQDAASQRFCAALGVKRGQTVLDLCAGAGGKSLALAAAGAKVLAHDVRPRALRELKKRALRADTRIEVGEPRKADIVVIDAPCSGTGRLRRDPALRLGLPLLDLDALAETQRGLIAQGAALVKPGGKLAYATCSLLAAEQHSAPAGWKQVDARVLWPHQGGTDGFSWRVWTRG